MKKYLYISFLLICFTSNAQTEVISKVPEIDSVFSTKLTGEFFIERKQYIGEQYFNKDWIIGDILLTTGEMIYNKSLKYNGLFDELIWLNTFNYGIFKLDKSFISDFWLKNTKGSNIHFKQICVSNNSKDSIHNIFMEVCVEGKVTLFIQRKISIQWPQYLIVNEVRQKYDVIEAAPEYFIKLPSNQFLKISKLQRKAFLRLFPDQKKAISRIISDNHLNINIESDFIKVIELINKEEIF